MAPDPASEDTAAVSPASHALGSVLRQPGPSWALSHTKPTQLACPPLAGHLGGRPPETITIGPKRAEQPDQKPPPLLPTQGQGQTAWRLPGRFGQPQLHKVVGKGPSLIDPCLGPTLGQTSSIRPLAPSSPPTQSHWVFLPILPPTQLQMRKLMHKLCLRWFRQRRC